NFDATEPAIAVTHSGASFGLQIDKTNPGDFREAVAITQSGIGDGIAVHLENAANGSRGLDIRHDGIGPGVFASSVGGIGMWGSTSSLSAAGIIGENTKGEAVVGRVFAPMNPTFPPSGVGAVVGRHDWPEAIGVRGFVTGTNA